MRDARLGLGCWRKRCLGCRGPAPAVERFDAGVGRKAKDGFGT